MKTARILVGLGLLAAVGAVYAARRNAAEMPPEQEAEPMPLEWVPAAQISWFEQAANWSRVQASEVFDMSSNTSAELGARNVAAFLEAIAWSEGTAQQADPYAVCYAYRFRITDFRDHPAVLGVWRGEPLSEAMCAAAGLGAGCVSTAAGKFQLIRPTWVGLKKRLELPDFGPQSQDAAAVQLLKDCGAWSAISKGDFAEAVRLARRTWASLPGAGYGQPERRAGDLQARYVAAGGVLA